jgi:acetone carboxylase gamma subunit
MAQKGRLAVTEATEPVSKCHLCEVDSPDREWMATRQHIHCPNCGQAKPTGANQPPRAVDPEDEDGG